MKGISRGKYIAALSCRRGLSYRYHCVMDQQSGMPKERAKLVL